MPVIVDHFGIHTAEAGVEYLEQQRTPRDGIARRESTSTNALGTRSFSPFRVRPLGKIRECNHDIRINEGAPAAEHWQTFMELVAEDELVRALLPIRYDPPLTVFAPQWSGAHEYLVMLSQMSAPLRPIVRTVWNMTARQVLSELEITNCQPLILTDLSLREYRDGTKLEDIALGRRGKPRTLVTLGDAMMIPPPGFKIITTTLPSRPLQDLLQLPWTRIGGTVVRKFMRGEWKV